MAAKMRPKRARTQRYTATPRGRVRGKPAYATGAFPTLAPALVRRRPRRTSRRAKRPSPQPCPRRRRAVCSAATAPRDELQNVSRRWRVGGVEVPSRIRAGPGTAALQPPIDRPGRTCSTAASPRRRSSLEQQRGPSKGPRESCCRTRVQVGAGTGPSGAGEKSQEDSHRVKMGGGRRKK